MDSHSKQLQIGCVQLRMLLPFEATDACKFRLCCQDGEAERKPLGGSWEGFQKFEAAATAVTDGSEGRTGTLTGADFSFL